jgi:hypothetical protein
MSKKSEQKPTAASHRGSENLASSSHSSNSSNIKYFNLNPASPDSTSSDHNNRPAANNNNNNNNDKRVVKSNEAKQPAAKNDAIRKQFAHERWHFLREVTLQLFWLDWLYLI